MWNPVKPRFDKVKCQYVYYESIEDVQKRVGINWNDELPLDELNQKVNDFITAVRQAYEMECGEDLIEFTHKTKIECERSHSPSLTVKIHAIRKETEAERKLRVSRDKEEIKTRLLSKIRMNHDKLRALREETDQMERKLRELEANDE